MKILMVCLGNICRSPLAQGILEEKIRKKNLGWQVDSSGTGSWHIGEQPDKRSIAIARENNIDISGQRARQFSPGDLDEYDLILAMDTSNYNNIINHATNGQKDKVEMILNYVYPGENRSVPDPYFEGGFDHVFELLDKACENLVISLEEKNKF